MTNGTGGEESTWPYLARTINIPASASLGRTVMQVEQEGIGLLLILVEMRHNRI
jgi:hypothetical protein